MHNIHFLLIIKEIVYIETISVYIQEVYSNKRSSNLFFEIIKD
ncbi:unnamed protein product [Paramecium pentaurelia]|uniref:Uncharacterized protein n=1 Tax=Paramecium pentaurelia TaxID=43138 RepID=A0A8S1SXE0_9CILI|nr:unnamed protein product [Paramecium pentaurelia]